MNSQQVAEVPSVACESVEFEPREIALLFHANRMLAEARTIDEVKEIRDQAEAMRMYLKQRDAGLEAQNMAAEIKVRAERRMGQLLKDGPKHPPGPVKKDRSHRENDLPPSRAEMGIEHNQADRWQSIAKLPEPEFERHLAETKSAGKELTTAGVLRLAKKSDPTESREPAAWDLVDATDYLDSKLKEILAKWPREHVAVMGHQLCSLGREILESGELRP